MKEAHQTPTLSEDVLPKAPYLHMYYVQEESGPHQPTPLLLTDLSDFPVGQCCE